MTYTIDCILTNRGPRYRVALWCGRVCYQGMRDYAQHGDAVKAAKRTGALARETTR